MIVERNNDAIIIKFSAPNDTTKVQAILDYLHYEELTSNSTATEDNVNTLLNKAKKGRWGRIKSELGLDE